MACRHLGIFPARVKRGHAANRKCSAFVTNFRQQLPQPLEEGHIVRNRIAIRKHPFGIVQIEVDQAGHVVPAAQIQAEDVLA